MSKRNVFMGFGLLLLTLSVAGMAGCSCFGGKSSTAMAATPRQETIAECNVDLVGPRGPDGFTGPAGPQGPIGLTGAAGGVLVGPRGAEGPAGPAGIQGATGAMGPAGGGGAGGGGERGTAPRPAGKKGALEEPCVRQAMSWLVVSA